MADALSRLHSYKAVHSIDKLSNADIAVLRPHEVYEALTAKKVQRPIRVIGLYSADSARSWRMGLNGMGKEQIDTIMHDEETEYKDYERLCHIVINNETSLSRNALDDTAIHVKSFIDECESQAWSCTDNERLQFCRKTGTSDGKPVFELAQVNQYGDSLFHVAHGFVYLSDLNDDDIGYLLSLYDQPLSALLSAHGLALLAQASFETSGTEYDIDEEYTSFEDAAKALGQRTGIDISSYLP